MKTPTRVPLRRILPCLLVLPPLATPLSAQADMGEVGQGVVRIFAEDETRGWTGSGFVVNDEGYIVTNHHVVEGALVIMVMTSVVGEAQAPEVDRLFGPRLARESRDEVMSAVFGHLVEFLVEAEVVMSDPDRDFAIIRAVGLSEYRPLPLVLSPQVSVGQEVRALGYPGAGDDVGLASMLRLKITNGIIASKEYMNELDRPVYQITADISGGNSGGPLVDMCGAVTAINTFGLQFMRGQGVPDYTNYSVQIDPVVQQLMDRGIEHRVVAAACVPAVAGPAPDPYTRGMLILSLMLGASAVWLASTRRGRVAVAQSVRRVGHTVASVGGRHARGRHAPSVPPVAAPAARPVLFALGGPYKDSTLELGKEPLTIGRDPRVSQLVFPPDASEVSKRHCRLSYDAPGRRFTLEDCWSTNGTFVGSGQRVEPESPQTLRPGDRFYVGDRAYLFEVRLEEPR